MWPATSEHVLASHVVILMDIFLALNRLHERFERFRSRTASMSSLNIFGRLSAARDSPWVRLSPFTRPDGASLNRTGNGRALSLVCCPCALFWFHSLPVLALFRGSSLQLRAREILDVRPFLRKKSSTSSLSKKKTVFVIYSAYLTVVPYPKKTKKRWRERGFAAHKIENQFWASLLVF